MKQTNNMTMQCMPRIKLLSIALVLLIVFLSNRICDGKGLPKAEKLMKSKLKEKKDVKEAAKQKERFISFVRPKAQWCNRIDRTVRMKKMAHTHIAKAVKSLMLDHNITVDEKKFHISRFKVLEKELNETQEQIVETLNWLNDVLLGDYKDIINMRVSSKKRLEALRDAAVKEEQEYNAIALAEVGGNKWCLIKFVFH